MSPITKVALLAVHGVADQKPGQTARELANLVHDCLPGAQAFETHEVLIPVRSLADERKPSPAKPARRIARLPHSDFSRGRFNAPEQAVGFDVEYSADLVRDHQVRDSEALYRTERLSTTVGAAQPTQVDVYEMYWADLSRLASGAWRILSEFYQLIFHLGSLGRHTMDAARAQSAPTRLLSWLSRMCAVSEYALVGPIGMGNVVLLALALLLAGALLVDTAAWLFTAALLFMYALAVFYGAWRSWPAKRGIASVYASFTLVCAAGMCAALFAHYHNVTAHVGLLLLTGLPLAAAVAGYAAMALARRNVGAGAWAAVAGILVVIVLLAQFASAGVWPWLLPCPQALSIVAQAVVLLFALIMLGWLLLAAAQLAFAVGAVIAHLQQSSSIQRDTLSAVRTAMLCMMVSTSLFAVLTISLWALVVNAGLPQTIEQAPLQLLFDPIDNASNVSVSVQQFTQALLSASASFFFPTLIALGLLGLTAFVLFLPSLVTEAVPRRDKTDSPHLGHWLDAALPWLGRAVAVVAIAYISVMILQVSAPLRLSGETVLQRYASTTSNQWVSLVAWSLAASATSLLALGPALSKSLGRWRVVLDIALDIDNYFREHPRSANPRGRIYARYAATLRHLQQQGYAKVVIVAHSQGTVISADLLRLMHAREHLPTAALASALNITLPPTVLITAGSPLAQLYRARFAHLYRWIDALNPQWQQLAQHFGLQRWVNVYTSGDYVGRSFWRGPSRYNQENTPAAVDKQRAEMCIGAGAHTHYFERENHALAQAICGELLSPPLTVK
jgi:hypothetical protein